MKTTIDLPDEVLRKAKVFAAEHRTTLRELVMRGLELATETPAADEQKARKAALRGLLGEMRANNAEPMAPLRREDLYDR